VLAGLAHPRAVAFPANSQQQAIILPANPGLAGAMGNTPGVGSRQGGNSPFTVGGGNASFDSEGAPLGGGTALPYPTTGAIPMPNRIGNSGGISADANGKPSLGFNLADVAGPTAWQVSGDQTVASQLTNLMRSDNPIIQMARTRAMQSANNRGLVNSSMALSGADAAAYEAMMDVAKQDASTNASAAQTNTNAQNQFTSAANDFTRSGYMADFNLDANNWAAWQDFERERQRMALQSEYGDTDQDREFAQSDRQGYINGINQARSDWAAKYAAIASDSNISPENRDAALSGLASSYNTTIRQYASFLGWDPASWVIDYSVPNPDADKPTEPENIPGSTSGDGFRFGDGN
jgi:hypothetical protein